MAFDIIYKYQYAPHAGAKDIIFIHESENVIGIEKTAKDGTKTHVFYKFAEGKNIRFEGLHDQFADMRRDENGVLRGLVAEQRPNTDPAPAPIDPKVDFIESPEAIPVEGVDFSLETEIALANLEISNLRSEIGVMLIDGAEDSALDAKRAELDKLKVSLAKKTAKKAKK